MSSIKQGYKQTKVGIIPEDWEVVKLSSLSEKISDGIHTTPVYTDNTDFYFINGNNLVKNSIQVSEITKTVSEDEYRKHRIDLDSKTILMSINGTIGNLAIYNGEKIILGKSACYMILKNKSSLRFVYSLLQSRNTQKSFEAELTGSTIKNLSLKTIKDTHVPCPPLKEQEKIAEILTTWDEAISKQEELIKAKEEQKKSLMQKLLSGEVRFSGFSDEWEEKKLGDIGEFKKGTAFTIAELISGDIPVIAGGKEPAYYHNQHNRTGKTITVSSSGASAGFVNYFEIPIFVSDSFTIKGKSNISDTKYFYFFLTQIQNKIFALQSGGAQPHIYPKDLQILHIKLPSLAEQQKIAEVLSLADEEISLLKKELDELKLQKKGLMQKLLTGEVRVKK